MGRTTTQSLSGSVAGEAADLGQLRAEIERLERELAHQVRINLHMEEAVQEFVSTLAHDLKNPLAAIKIGVQGFHRALQRAGSLTLDEGAERLERLDSAVEHAKEVIADARAKALDRSSAPRPLERQLVDLAAVLREAVQPFVEQVGPERLEVSYGRAKVMASLDARRLRQCVAAVVDNALKFSGGSTQVKLSLKREGEIAAITCRDQGIGIPAGDLPHIGERFYRAENVLGRYKGAGLGLFEAMASVLAHDGHMAVESVEGTGTELTIRIPLR